MRDPAGITGHYEQALYPDACTGYTVPVPKPLKVKGNGNF